jgi:N-acetylneuraminic acid mutarotase
MARIRRRLAWLLVALILGACPGARRIGEPAPSPSSVAPTPIEAPTDFRATPPAAGPFSAGPERRAEPPWRQLATPPIEARFGHVAVWTGREMIVWGGAGNRKYRASPLADGAAYDPVADRWRILPPAPIAARSVATAVWTGREMIVWGGSGGHEVFEELADGAAYDPARNSWRRLPDSPLTPRAGHSAVWTGKEMTVLGGEISAYKNRPHRDGAAYDPSANRWRSLPASPLGLRSRHEAVWTGAEMIVVGGRYDPEAPFAAAYDPARSSWRTIRGGPIDREIVQAAVWTGRDMVVFGASGENEIRGRTASYRPRADTWRSLPPSRLANRCGQVAVWTGREVLLLGALRVRTIHRSRGTRPTTSSATDGWCFLARRFSNAVSTPPSGPDARSSRSGAAARAPSRSESPPRSHARRAHEISGSRRPLPLGAGLQDLC